VSGVQTIYAGIALTRATRKGTCMKAKYSSESHFTQTFMSSVTSYGHCERLMVMVMGLSVLPKLQRLVGVERFDFDLELPILFR